MTFPYPTSDAVFIIASSDPNAPAFNADFKELLPGIYLVPATDAAIIAATNPTISDHTEITPLTDLATNGMFIC